MLIYDKSCRFLLYIKNLLRKKNFNRCICIEQNNSRLILIKKQGRPVTASNKFEINS